MKNTFVTLATTFILLVGCSKKDINNEAALTETTNVAARQKCASHEVLEEQLRLDPNRAARLREIERIIDNYEKNPSSARPVRGIEIPVVVNVLYKTPAQDISEAQIRSQIDVMNKDFAAANSDYNNTPALFQSVRSGDTKITFVLKAINKKYTNKPSWPINDGMKKSQTGGIDATSPSTTLNIWSCNLNGGILGYAQFPGGNPVTDGIVIDDNAFGNTGTAEAPYGLGRTATHEIGHWLNLRHIWGDATCGNDFVDDTPVAQSYNGGCPIFPKYGNCSSTVPMMTMNYMDYTYDACMYMFTAGQNTRMQATFTPGGGRESFVQP